MRGINVFIGEEDLKDQGHTVNVITNDGCSGWVVARPLGYIGLLHTLQCAWKVLRGKADIVIWKYQ